MYYAIIDYFVHRIRPTKCTIRNKRVYEVLLKVPYNQVQSEGLTIKYIKNFCYIIFHKINLL